VLRLQGGAGPATFALRTLDLGTADKNGWKRLGFDIDGDVSTGASTNLCQPLDGASKTFLYPDGDLGIDNAFGHFIVPLVTGVDKTVPAATNDALAAGRTTLLFELASLGDDPDQGPLLGRLYVGAPTASSPRWDGTDVWPVASASLEDPADLSSATVTFPESYVTGDTWVGHAAGPIPLTLTGATSTLHFTIHDAVVAMTLDPARMGATSGVLSGILLLPDLVAETDRIGLSLFPDYCTESVRPVVSSLIQQAADILADGTQDPSRPCQAISLGIGFTASRVHLGPIAAPSPAERTPSCP
jgi:hypothetical protein